MSRNLSKGLKAQKHIEKKAKSRFGKLKEELTTKKQPLTPQPVQEKPSPPQPMIKLTTTITQKTLDYLQKEVLSRSQKKGKVQNMSQTLREILHEHQSKN